MKKQVVLFLAGCLCFSNFSFALAPKTGPQNYAVMRDAANVQEIKALIAQLIPLTRMYFEVYFREYNNCL